MKKLLIGLLVLGSISSFANVSDCTITLSNQDGAISLNDSSFINKAEKVVIKKGLNLITDHNAEYQVDFRGVVYMNERDPKYVTAVGMVASLSFGETKIEVVSEDALVMNYREDKRLRELAIKSLKKAIKNIDYCQE